MDMSVAYIVHYTVPIIWDVSLMEVTSIKYPDDLELEKNGSKIL